MRPGRSSRYDRREFAAVAAGLVPLGILHAADIPGDALVTYAKIHDKWNADHLYEFINHLPDEARLSLKKALELVNQDAEVGALKGKSKDMAEIQDKLLWVSEHVLGYLWKDKAQISYHQVVTWVAGKVGISQTRIAAGSTFALERAILQQLFESLWDKLDLAQRLEVLKEIDPDGRIMDKAAAVAHNGRAALGHFRKAVKFCGFKFYTTMARVISAVAKLFRVTLPFAVYTGAARIVAFLTGPIGWAIMAVLAAAELAIAGRADPRRTTAFVLQMHMLRVSALVAAGWAEEKVFTPSILYPGGGRLEADREVAAEWEQFRLVKNRNGTWSFAAYTGYLCAEGGGGGDVIANRDVIGEWEEWTWVDRPDGKVSLQSSAGYFLCAEEGGARVVANRKKAGEWEQFVIAKDPAGDTCTIKTWQGTFVSVQPE
jgi:uncharacterized protein YaaW (UPF0174 family)